MNRAQLIAFLKSQGYAGNATLEDIQKWIDENGITIAGKSGVAIDVKKAWETKSVLTVEAEATDEADAETDADAEDETDADAVTITGDEAAAFKAFKKTQAKANRGKGFSAVGGIARPSSPNTAFNTSRLDFKAYEARVNRGGTIFDASPETPHKRVTFGSAEECELFGALVRKSLFGEGGTFEYVKLPEYEGQKALDAEICRKANLETNFSSGGFSVPDVFSSSLIRIRAAYGALPMLLNAYPMSGMSESIPRDANSGVTVYAPGEGVTATESTPAGDQVKLNAFEMVALATVSRRLLAHSAINFGDFISNSMMYAAAKKSDEIYIYGDGTSTYFNQQGLIGKFVDLVLGAGGTWTLGTNSTNADYAAGMTRAASATWSSITEANIRSVISSTLMTESGLPEMILCHKTFYEQVLKTIAMGKGGVTSTEVVNGIAVPMWDGYPVIRSNAMPSRSAVNDSVVMFFGDFASGSKYGEVQGSQEMTTNDSRYWELRKVGFQLAKSVAFNVHDVGNASSTAANRVTGPITGLITTST